MPASSGVRSVLDRLDDAGAAAPLVVRFELQLLSELGFGLDLPNAPATGARADSSMSRRNRAARCRA